MRIVVLIKEVPDSAAKPSLNIETGLTVRQETDNAIDEINERALEAALRLAEKSENSEVALLSLSPASGEAVLRRGLAIGADSATHICDPLLVGADLGLTARALSASLQTTEFDLLIAGNSSSDSGTGAIPFMLSEILGIPCVTGLSSLEHVDSQSFLATRNTETNVETLKVAYPAIVTITESFPECRHPNFKGILAAKKKPLQAHNLSDLGLDINPEAVSYSVVLSASQRPSRAAGVKIVDSGSAAKELAHFLMTKGLLDRG